MGKKLAGNGMWESSRFIIPEYQEAINRQTDMNRQKTKPNLHEDELETIMQLLSFSLNQKESIHIIRFDPFQDQEFEGVVSLMNPYRKELKFVMAEEWVVIRFDEIIGVRLM